MQKLFVFFCFILLLQGTYSQNWKEGYVLTVKKDTLFGMVSQPWVAFREQVDLKANGQRFLFKSSEILSYKHGNLEYRSLFIPHAFQGFQLVEWNPDQDELLLGFHSIVRTREKGKLTLYEHRFNMNFSAKKHPKIYILYKPNQCMYIPRSLMAIILGKVKKRVHIMIADKPDLLSKYAKVRYRDIPKIVQEYNH